MTTSNPLEKAIENYVINLSGCLIRESFLGFDNHQHIIDREWVRQRNSSGINMQALNPAEAYAIEVMKRKAAPLGLVFIARYEQAPESLGLWGKIFGVHRERSKLIKEFEQSVVDAYRVERERDT